MANMKIISMNAASDEVLRAEASAARLEARRNLLDVASALRLQINDLIQISHKLREDVDALMKQQEQEGHPPKLNG